MLHMISIKCTNPSNAKRAVKQFFVTILMTLLLLNNDAHAHSGQLNKKAISVCLNKARSTVCQYEGGHNDLYKGTCQYMMESLICVRNQPIQKIPTNLNISPEDFQEEGHNHKD